MHVYPGKQEYLIIGGQRRVIDPDFRLVKRALDNTVKAQLIQAEWCLACHRNPRQVSLQYCSGLPPCHCKPKISLPLGSEVQLQPLRQIGHACAAEAAM